MIIKPNFECCYKCDKRHPGCHSTCKDYLNEKEDYNNRVQKIKESSLVDDYIGKKAERYSHPKFNKYKNAGKQKISRTREV